MAMPGHWREAKNAVIGNTSKAWHPKPVTAKSLQV
jgi:hypothetical protein